MDVSRSAGWGLRRSSLSLAGLALLAGLMATAGCDPSSTGPEPERLLGTQILGADELGPTWAWLNASEILFVGPGGIGINAVDAATGARRVIVSGEAVESIRRVEPYVYYVQGTTLYRARLEGGSPPEEMVDFGSVDDWSVSADHRWAFWLASTFVMRESLETGTQDTVFMPGQTLHMRVFAGPADSSAFIVNWDRFPGVFRWIRYDGSTVDGRPPCRIVEGSAVHWEDGAPILYAACPDVFLRHPATGDSTRVATIGGSQDGTFAPDFSRVSAWRRYCPRWTEDSLCPEAERELWLADAGETPGLVGTLILEARSTDSDGSVVTNPLDDTGPAYFSPGGDYVAYELDAGSEHDGLWVLPLE